MTKSRQLPLFLMSHLDRSFGLTGGMASGKSTAARMFEELGAKVIDADRLGHELIRAPLPAYQEIVRRFGSEILDSCGEIDRRRLAAVVFSDPQKLGELNALLHPPIMARVEELAAGYQAADAGGVVLVEAALIYEARLEGRFAKIVVAWCRSEQQFERGVAKGLTREEAAQRLAAQMPIEEKRSRADYVIDCSGSKESTRAQVERLYPELQRQVSEP
jgi:dephospho-CoA kinase